MALETFYSETLSKMIDSNNSNLFCSSELKNVNVALYHINHAGGKSGNSSSAKELFCKLP